MNFERGLAGVKMQDYKRYRVSSQRFSNKPLNVEFVILTDTHRYNDNMNAKEVSSMIRRREERALIKHPEGKMMAPE